MKISKGDRQRRQEAFNKKVEEFSLLTLDQLKERFEVDENRRVKDKELNKFLGGSYRHAVLYVVEFKLMEEKQKAVTTAIEEVKGDKEKIDDESSSI